MQNNFLTFESFYGTKTYEFFCATELNYMSFHKRILSGVRPTGIIHLGNYLGAIHQWVKSLQNQDATTDHLFCIVDLHALTTLEDSKDLGANARLMAATYLACGLDPKKCHIFRQSDVPAHTELSWIFSCITPMGWLNRMTQFKDKAGKNAESACLGLYAYPVLMAADILLYRATHVPVGDDQKQHVELSRDIAGAFNRRFVCDYFQFPEPVIQGPATRIMSLRDGTSKMSKSDISDYSRIHLTDDADMIAKKIKKAKTDVDPVGESMKAMENRPEARNLLNMLSSLIEKPVDDVCQEFAGNNFSSLKHTLIDALHAKILPIGEKIREYQRDETYLNAVLKEGAGYANALASTSMEEIKTIIGMR